MKNVFIILGAVLAIVAIIVVIVIPKDNAISNDDAQKDKEGRYLTIINATAQIINEVHITVGEGTEIEAMTVKNPDDDSFSVEVPESYDEYTSFLVTLVDRYGLKYQKEIDAVPVTGRTEVKLSEENYVEEKGDWWDKVNKFFNGD